MYSDVLETFQYLKPFIQGKTTNPTMRRERPAHSQSVINQSAPRDHTLTQVNHGGGWSDKSFERTVERNRSKRVLLQFRRDGAAAENGAIPRDAPGGVHDAAQ